LTRVHTFSLLFAMIWSINVFHNHNISRLSAYVISGRLPWSDRAPPGTPLGRSCASLGCSGASGHPPGSFGRLWAPTTGWFRAPGRPRPGVPGHSGLFGRHWAHTPPPLPGDPGHRQGSFGVSLRLTRASRRPRTSHPRHSLGSKPIRLLTGCCLVIFKLLYDCSPCIHVYIYIYIC
jgi:hypothetical protein